MASTKMKLRVALEGLDGSPIEQHKTDSRGKPVMEFAVDDDDNKIPVRDKAGDVIPGRFEKEPVWETVYLSDILATYVSKTYEEDKDIPYPKIQQRGALAKKIARAMKEISYTVDEIAVIEEMISRNKVSIVADQFENIKNGTESFKEVEPESSGA